MKRVLQVDDDPVVLRIYRPALLRAGFQLETAADGLEAIKAIRTQKPDIVVLDLMMPKFSGVDVLQFIRSQPDLADLPVLVLSNLYMDDMVAKAVELGARKGLLKVRCNPALLVATIDQILEAQGRPEPPSTARPPAGSAQLPASAQLGAASPRAGAEEASPSGEVKQKVRAELLANAGATCGAIRQCYEAFATARTDAERELRLQDLYRKVRFVTATAGIGGCHRLAHMASAFEALLFVLMEQRSTLTHSLRRTASMAVDCLEVLFRHAAEPEVEPPTRAQILVVDDDPAFNRRAVSALGNAMLEATGTLDPLAGLQLMQTRRFDLLVLDLDMPRLGGIEFARRARALPGHEKIPIIYLAGPGAPDAVPAGGNDVIAKPIILLELAAKAVRCLLTPQFA